MKKIIITLLLISFTGVIAQAAKYKVNTSGQVTSQNGRVQTAGSQNPFNNYYAQPYVNQNISTQGGAGTIDIVMDFSGSMVNWIAAAKTYMSAIVSQLSSETKVGFRVFGHNGGNNPYNPVMAQVKNVIRKTDGKYKVTAAKSSYLGSTSGSCSATTQAVSVSPNNSLKLNSAMNSYNIGGSTPLTLALEQSVEYDFAGMGEDYVKKIILITDGGENCGGDPCAFARSLMAKRSDIIIDVVLVSSDSRALTCLSDLTGGKFYNPVDVPSFVDVLDNSLKTIDSTKPSLPSNGQQQPSQQYEYVKE